MCRHRFRRRRKEGENQLACSGFDARGRKKTLIERSSYIEEREGKVLLMYFLEYEGTAGLSLPRWSSGRKGRMY